MRCRISSARNLSEFYAFAHEVVPMPRFIITGVPRLAIQDFWKRIWDEAVRRVFSVIVQNCTAARF
jgi:hypothetical protein